MAQIDADYLGGDPSQPQPYEGGKLGFASSSLTFLVQVFDNPIKPRRVEFALPMEEIRAISVGDANHMKTLTRTAVGAAIGVRRAR